MKPLVLIILDGWGYTPLREGNAVALASIPSYDGLMEKYPHTLLEASGTRVGLPAGVMGNSEVGHLNLGAGRVIRTNVIRIDDAIETGEFFANPVLVAAMDGAKARGSSLHLMGLLSDGLVHSSQKHLYALLRMAEERDLQRVYVHCFLDGRDTPPISASGYVKALQSKSDELASGLTLFHIDSSIKEVLTLSVAVSAPQGRSEPNSLAPDMAVASALSRVRAAAMTNYIPPAEDAHWTNISLYISNLKRVRIADLVCC